MTDAEHKAAIERAFDALLAAAADAQRDGLRVEIEFTAAADEVISAQSLRRGLKITRTV